MAKTGFEKAIEGFLDEAERRMSDVFEVLLRGSYRGTRFRILLKTSWRKGPEEWYVLLTRTGTARAGGRGWPAAHGEGSAARRGWL